MMTILTERELARSGSARGSDWADSRRSARA
jgi:hypothetical protein